MNDSRWLKSWLEVNESHYKGIGRDMSVVMYDDDMLCSVCTATIDPENEEYASGYVDKYGSYYMCEECK